MEQKRFYLTRKKAVGFVGLCLWLLVFVFACCKDSLVVGKILAHTFGFMTYPLAIVMSLISLAMFLGFSYSRNKRSTAYLMISLISIICLIHSIVSFCELEKVVGGTSLVEYLSASYSEMTIFGALGALVSGIIAIALGEMGVVVLFGIIATLFAGLFIDYNFYGKYEENVKKLKGHSLREKVHKSDKKRTADGSPVYSFSNKYSNEDVVGEVSISENEIAENSQEVSFEKYSDSDVVGEITSDETFESEAESAFDFGFGETATAAATAGQTESIYPDVFSKEDADKHRRDFMNATWGNYETEPQTQSTGFSFEEENNSNDIYSDFNSNKASNDDISSILSSREDEDEFEENIDAFEINSFKSHLDEGNSSLKTTDYAKEINSAIESANNSGFGFMQQTAKPETQKIQPISKNINTQNAMIGVRYNPPPLSLLKSKKPDKGDYSEEQTRKSTQLENVLAAFNIPAKVQKIVRGPKITRYELSVPLGVSVKQIPRYENDIAAALSAKAIVIRAPIPGSPYVGIELENDTFTTVSQRELLESSEFQNSKDPLTVAIGKDISGEIVVKSLAKMVHVLVAGSTGSGKSVFIHNIILSLIYKLGPEDVRFIIIDPKKVELNCYDGLPHLLTPEVVKGSEKAISALKWCVREMDRRYDLMSKSGYNNIEPYNKSELVKAGQFEKFPYIVIIVDELAEIMTMNKKEVELCIQRLTQLARACGMHLVLATQRPSVDIISGVIKNNVPSRIAFSLQSGIDSKTILNTVGAEKLLGQGDMLFNPTGTSTMPRLQAAYASDEEIKAVIDYDKKYNKANFDTSIEAAINAEPAVDDGGMGGGFGVFEEPPQRDTVDSYFKTATKLVMANGGASVSYLQRRLSIGYARAARIVDQMEEKGYIAASNGSKLRKVLITPEQFAEDFGEDFNSIDD